MLAPANRLEATDVDVITSPLLTRLVGLAARPGALLDRAEAMRFPLDVDEAPNRYAFTRRRGWRCLPRFATGPR